MCPYRGAPGSLPDYPTVMGHEGETMGDISNWGGAREGAGAKPVFDKPAKVTVQFRITAEHAAAIQALARDGESLNLAVRRQLEELELEGGSYGT